jgi:hypothetical protein
MFLLLFIFLIVCVVLIAVFTAQILFVVLAAATACAVVISLLWKTPTPEQTLKKRQTLTAFVVFSLAVAFPFAIESAKSKLFPDTTEFNRRRDEIMQIFDNPGIDDKFARSYAIAAGAEEDWERRDLKLYVLDAFLHSNAKIVFSEEDLIAAQTAYDALDKPFNAGAVDYCATDTKSIYAKTVVSRQGPASVVNFLRDHYRDQYDCGQFSKILYEVGVKCRTIWAVRCTTEINREELEAFLLQPMNPVVKSDIQEFITTIFPQY